MVSTVSQKNMAITSLRGVKMQLKFMIADFAELN